MKKETLLAKCDLLRQQAQTITFMSKGSIRLYEWIGIYSAALTFLEAVFGPNHHYVKFFPADGDASFDSVRIIKSLLDNAYEDIKDNWHLSLKKIIASEFFSDFLEMAEHFLDQGYKEPAAVLIGGVLEENLRSLCVSHNIALTELKGNDIVSKKTERLNQDLGKAKVYASQIQKAVTGWLDLRNKAAHGKHNEYTHNEVNQMLSGIRLFLEDSKD